MSERKTWYAVMLETGRWFGTNVPWLFDERDHVRSLAKRQHGSKAKACKIELRPAGEHAALLAEVAALVEELRKTNNILENERRNHVAALRKEVADLQGRALGERR